MDWSAELEAELARIRQEKPLHIKIGNKQNVVVGGPGLRQRFPVTLYAPGWVALLEAAEDIKAFIEANREQLSWK